MKHTKILLYIACVLLSSAMRASAQAGQYDPTYGMGGIVSLPNPNMDNYLTGKMAIHNQNDVVVVGSNDSETIFAYRLPYHLNGGLDPDFGDNGLAIWPEKYPGFKETYLALVAPGNKTLAVINEYNFDEPEYDHTRLFMFDAQGNPDPSFGDQGTLVLDLAPGTNEEYLYKGIVLPDGKILLCGLVYNTNYPQGIVIRLNPDGSFDETFNGTGRYELPVNIGPSALATMALTPNGNIVTGGTILNLLTDSGTPILFKLNSNGMPDTQFGNNGLLKMEFAESQMYYVGDLIYFPDGQIITVGVRPDEMTATVMALNPDGSLNDAAFNGVGYALIPVPKDGNVTDLPRLAHSEYERVFVMFGYNFFNEKIFEYQYGYMLTAINMGLFPDPNFGDNGFTNKIETGAGSDIAVDQEGSIYVCSVGQQEGAMVHISRFNGYPTSSTHTPALLTELSVAPNPANQQISLRLSLAQAENLQIALIGPDGRLCSLLAPLRHYAEGEHQLQFALEGECAPGIYRIAVTAGNGRTAIMALSIVR